jgi:hypothetical protein
MIDQERDLLAEYCKETNFPWTLDYLIDDHRNLANERMEVEAEAKEAESRGFYKGLAQGLRSCELLKELTLRKK